MPQEDALHNAAALMLLLGDAEAGAVMRQLQSEQAQALRQAIAKIDANHRILGPQAARQGQPGSGIVEVDVAIDMPGDAAVGAAGSSRSIMGCQAALVSGVGLNGVDAEFASREVHGFSHVTGGVDVRDFAAEVRIHDDQAALAGRESRGGEIQALGVAAASGAHEHAVTRKLGQPAMPVGGRSAR